MSSVDENVVNDINASNEIEDNVDNPNNANNMTNSACAFPLLIKNNIMIFAIIIHIMCISIIITFVHNYLNDSCLLVSNIWLIGNTVYKIMIIILYLCKAIANITIENIPVWYHLLLLIANTLNVLLVLSSMNTISLTITFGADNY